MADNLTLYIDNIIAKANGKIRFIDFGTSEGLEIVNKCDQGTIFRYNVFVTVLYGDKELEKLSYGVNQLITDYYDLSSLYIDGPEDHLLRIAVNRRDIATVKDISDYGVHAQMETLHCAILSARQTAYDYRKNFYLYLRLYRLDKNRVVCVTQILNTGNNSQIHSYLKSLFPTKELTSYEKLSSVSPSAHQSLKYWIDKFSHMVPDSYNTVHHSVGKLSTDIMHIPTELADALKRILTKDSHIDIRTVFMTTWALILARQLNRINPIMACSGSHGNLALSFIQPQTDLELIELFGNVAKQFKDADLNDACFLEDIVHSTNIQLAELASFIQCYSDIVDTSRIFDMIEENAVLSFNPYKYELSNLSVTYVLASDEMQMIYNYNPSILDGNDISQLHEAFVNTALSILAPLAKMLAPSKEISIPHTPYTINNTHSIKRTAIANCHIFKSLSEVKLDELAKHSELLTYLMDSIILSTDVPADMLYIVASGKIDLFTVDSDGLERSLGIISAGMIFGSECITSDPSHIASYRVYSPSAKLIGISPSVLKSLADDNPVIYQELLRNEHNNVNKYQKLWLMAD